MEAVSEGVQAHPPDHAVVDVERDEKEVPQADQKKKSKESINIVNLWQHKEPIAKVAKSVNSNVKDGLSTPDAMQRLKKDGNNELTQIPDTPWWIDLLHQFSDFFSLLLQFAAVLSLAAYLYDPTDKLHLYIFLFLYTVVLVTCTFTFIQKRRSDRTLREFQNFLPPKAVAIRDGKAPMLVDADRLVVGDIIRVTSGDRIPADIRVIHCDDSFAVDCAALTGESTPVTLTSKVCDCVNPLEATNLAYFGCFAVQGTCKGIVIATGDATVFGKIAALTTRDHSNNDKSLARNQLTSLERDIQHFIVWISIFSVAMGMISLFIGFFLKVRFIQNVVYTLGIIVSNVPEGLVATVTVALTASARRMAKRNVIVKKLEAVETLGTTDVIVTDKTGTLTKAYMSVAHAAFGGTVDTVAEEGWHPPADNASVHVKKAFKALLHSASVCSTAYFERSGERNKELAIARKVRGDASETGVLRFTERMHDTMAYRKELDIINKIPFNSIDKLMVTLDDSEEDEETDHAGEGKKDLSEDHPDEESLLVVMKGAPERILENCDSLLSVSGTRPLSPDDRHLIDRQIEYFAQLGERVLAYAEKRVPRSFAEASLESEDDTGDLSTFISPSEKLVNRIGKLRFVGLLSLTDPPREGVPDAMKTLKGAGIRIMMVTGDHAETALAVAQSSGVITKSISHPILLTENKQYEIPDAHKSILVHGDMLPALTEDQWKSILSRDEVVFARASPQHKLDIVQRLQKMGHVVTATGDGCNDAPALRVANAGIAMGCTGSDVSRSVADVVLLDDNICNIVHGVREGRLIFDNLKKSVAYSLTSNIPQLLPFLAFVLIRLPLPISTALVLCIDLGTDVFPAIALAYEGPERDLLRRAPRATTGDRLLTFRLISFSALQLGLLQTIAGFVLYYVIYSDAGLLPTALPGLSRWGHFGSSHPYMERWMVGEQKSAFEIGQIYGKVSTGAAYRATFFSKTDPFFREYFSPGIARPGFPRMHRDEFRLLRLNTLPFGNMLKIIGAEKQRPPCAAYHCTRAVDGLKLRNDISCFNVDVNNGPVMLDRPVRRNRAVINGVGLWEGCVELWTPTRQQSALRSAQTAFFVGIVVVQIFTVFACRTRVVSVLPRLFQNRAIWLALLAELGVALIIVYVEPVSSGLEALRIPWGYWLPAIPFGMLIVFYDEVRKWFIRKHVDNVSGLIVPKRDFFDTVAAFVHRFTYW